MKDAMIRIDELQQDMVDKSKEIEGSSEYIEKKLALYDKDEKLRDSSKAIHLEEEKIYNEFLF